MKLVSKCFIPNKKTNKAIWLCIVKYNTYIQIKTTIMYHKMNIKTCQISVKNICKLKTRSFLLHHLLP